VAALRTKSEADKKAALEKLLVIATSLQTNEQGKGPVKSVHLLCLYLC